MSEDTIRTAIVEKPHAIGVLFTVGLALSQVVNVSSSSGGAIPGP